MKTHSTLTRLAAISLLILASNIIAASNTTDGEVFIRDFYASYITLSNESTCNTEVDKLLDTSLTPQLRERLTRITHATDGSAITRTQDFNNYMKESLHVTSKGNGWYIVSFGFSPNDKHKDSISVHLTEYGELLKIDYIAPFWHKDSCDGDLIYRGSLTTIKHEYANIFVKTFLKRYLETYASMPQQTERVLSQLRNDNLTASAINQFNKARIEHAEDGEGYDIIIGGYDFDNTWMEGVDVKALSDNTFIVEISHEGLPVYSIRLDVDGSKGNFRITGITVR